MRQLGWFLFFLIFFVSASSNDLHKPLVSDRFLHLRVVSRLGGGGGGRSGGDSSSTGAVTGGGGSKGGDSSGERGGTGGGAAVNSYGGGGNNHHPNRNATSHSCAARIPLTLLPFLLFSSFLHQQI